MTAERSCGLPASVETKTVTGQVNWYNAVVCSCVFDKRIPGFETLSYPERLSLLDLESLELRRLRADLFTTYKVIFGLLDVRSNFFVVCDNSITRGHPYKLMLEHCDNNSQKQFLSHG